jgi:hypothetical protein
MKRINVEIKGTSPLLMGSPKAMLEDEEQVKKATKKRNPKVEAESRAYRTKSKELYVPASAIYGCILNASSFHKIGKFTAKPILASGVRIEPEHIGLGVKKYDIDTRTVVIRGRGRIVRHRPKINDWKLKFEIVWNEKVIDDPEVIKHFLEEGGLRVGILEYSPRCKGFFGTFEITKWSEVK